MNWESQEDIERIIIGEILLSSIEEQLDAVIALDDKDLIEHPLHRQILADIGKLVLSGKHADTVSLYQVAENKPNNYAVILSFLTQNIVSSARVFQHINLLKFYKYKKDLQRNLRTTITDLDGMGMEEVEEIKEKLIGQLSGVSFLDKPNFVKLDEYKSKLREQLDSKRRIEGFSWGITDVDKWTSGIIKGRMYVLGGLKKSGKTRFVIHTMKELYKQEIPTGFISLEMPAYEINKLLTASFLSVNDLRFRAGSLLKLEERSAFESLDFNPKLFGIECKAGLGVEQVMGRIKIMAQMGFEVIFIDYLQRFKYNIHKEAQELASISNRIADATRQNNVAIVLLSQLSNLAEREKPTPGHLKGSGGIGESADTIILFDNLFRRTKIETDKNKIGLIFEQRYGDSGEETIYADLGSIKFGNYGW